MNYLNLFNCELGIPLAVLRELAGEDSKTHFQLVEICTCHFNEDVLGIERDLGRV